MIDKFNRTVEVVKSKEGTEVLIVNDIGIHSKYYPTKEAKKFIDAHKSIYENNKNVLVYGLGLGYHIKELLNRVDENTIIHIFDIDEEIQKIAIEMDIIKGILKDNRIKLYCGEFKILKMNF